MTYFADPSKVCARGVLPMELGEIEEASGELVQHFDSLEFSSFPTDLWELDYNGHAAPGGPQDVVPSPSEAVDRSSGLLVDLPSDR